MNILLNWSIPLTSILLLSVFVFVIPYAYADFSPIIPSYESGTVPGVSDFKKLSKSELVGSFSPFIINRENSEKIEIFAFYDLTKKYPIIIGYVEDSTDKRLKNYRPFNSDFLEMELQLFNGKGYYIFSERNGNSCLFPIDKYSSFMAGTYSGCDGGSVDVIETSNGFAFYAKITNQISKPTDVNPYSFSLYYGDITDSDSNGLLKEIKYFRYPQNFPGHIIPINSQSSKDLITNNGIISKNEFLFKPHKELIKNLSANEFDCADNTVTIFSEKESYDLDDIGKFSAKILTSSSENRIWFKIFEANGNLIYQKQSTLDSIYEVKFLVDFDKNGFSSNNVYKVEVEFGIDGPTDTLYFTIGQGNIPIINKSCKLYALHDSQNNIATFLVDVIDPSFSYFDQIQFYLDRKGDSLDKLTSDDLSFILNTNDFASKQYSNNGGWITKPILNDNARIIKSGDGYYAYLQVRDVSKDFRMSIEQLDYTTNELKSTQFPKNGFATYSEGWSSQLQSQSKYVNNNSDKYIQSELFQSVPYKINLIMIGGEWNTDYKNQILPKLIKSYSPIDSNKLSRLGVTYNYEYDFIQIDKDESKRLFEFMKNESHSWLNTFPGQDSFKDPWGFAPWIKNNHTEWIQGDRFTVNYKLIDASKMEDYLYENIIKRNPNYSTSNTSNLIFIADSMDDVDFLHTYELKTTDPVTKKPHSATGMMGFGGHYNFYFFDLYSVPWDDYMGFDFLYDKKWQNDKINFHDIHSINKKSELFVNYINNSTTMMITPSFLFTPQYSPEYFFDIFIVSLESDVDIPQLEKYFIDKSAIQKKLSQTLPNSKVDLKITVKDIKDTEMPKELKDIVNSKTFHYYFPNNPEYGGYEILSSEKLSKEVSNWAAYKFGNTDSKRTIPVLLLLVDTKYPIFLDRDGTVGMAVNDPNDPNVACCAFGVASDDQIWTKKVSPTDLLIHEIGHVLGYMHPFMGFDNSGKFKQFDYFERYYLSPMAYNTPLHGCGVWYNIHVLKEDETCGIGDTQFTFLEKNNYVGGITINLQKDIRQDIYLTMLGIEKNGGDLNSVSNDLQNRINQINVLLKKSEEKYKSGDYLGDNGALAYAINAKSLSSKLSASDNLNLNTESESSPKIPVWIKNNAKWWAEGQVDDTTFTQGIGYLIKEKIIEIDSYNSQSPDVPEQKVPDWIKNNAKWWADGMISEDDFMKGIEYLLKAGIIIP